MAEETNDGLPLKIWINVVLSFLFFAVGLPLLCMLALLLFSGYAIVLLFHYPYSWVGWGILAITLVLGYGNASRYYKRAKAELGE